MSVEPNLPDKGCPVPSLSDACPASPRGQHCPAQEEARKHSLGSKNVTSARGNLDVTDNLLKLLFKQTEISLILRTRLFFTSI